MIVTFARRVALDADLNAEEAALVATVERWVLAAELSGTFDPMPAVKLERSETVSFIETGCTRQAGLVEAAPQYELRRQILLEAKVEVAE
ncbi:hypothetical protein SEA_FRANSOYER_4 [Microbacterium phage Fransoyer]|nr:hypothetical protein SEA_RUBYRALPH_4 [Microbacterium phage RubyRalph]UUG69569.1 hypothetical protein SEA_FRANSOYER_4 [Microbacterium phage Fransoyer]